MDDLDNNPEYMAYEAKFKDYTDADFYEMGKSADKSIPTIANSGITMDSVYAGLNRRGVKPEDLPYLPDREEYIKYLSKNK